jgi:predicted DNA-binding WGR domain protein
MVGTRRFHCTVAGHNKFWHIIYDGRRLNFEWGAIGSKPQTLAQPKEFSSEWRAERAAEAVIAQKLAKGYIEVNNLGVPIVYTDQKDTLKKWESFVECGHQFHYSPSSGQQECFRCGLIMEVEEKTQPDNAWKLGVLKSMAEKEANCLHATILYDPKHKAMVCLQCGALNPQSPPTFDPKASAFNWSCMKGHTHLTVGDRDKCNAAQLAQAKAEMPRFMCDRGHDHVSLEGAKLCGKQELPGATKATHKRPVRAFDFED